MKRIILSLAVVAALGLNATAQQVKNTPGAPTPAQNSMLRNGDQMGRTEQERLGQRANMQREQNNRTSPLSQNMSPAAQQNGNRPVLQDTNRRNRDTLRPPLPTDTLRKR